MFTEEDKFSLLLAVVVILFVGVAISLMEIQRLELLLHKVEQRSLQELSDQMGYLRDTEVFRTMYANMELQKNNTNQLALEVHGNTEDIVELYALVDRVQSSCCYLEHDLDALYLETVL